jgi:hydroxymethylpyrimidine pyrophosphatase-like HAD family hydrolase
MGDGGVGPHHVKIIFFDMDDTLVFTDTQRIPDSAIKAITEAHSRGVKIAVATWRNMKLDLDAEPLSYLPPVTIFISHGGALTFTKDRVIESHVISNSDAKAVLDSGIPSIAFRESTITVHGDADKLWDWFKRTDLRLPGYVPEDSDDPRGVFTFLLPTEGPDLPLLESADGRISAHCRIVHPGKEVGKGTAVAKALEEIGIAKDNAMAFGDAEGDIGLLKAVGIGIAMGNGNAKLKEVATYVTDSVDHDGVAKALQHFGLA